MKSFISKKRLRKKERRKQSLDSPQTIEANKNVKGRNSSELKDINLKYILSKQLLRYININLPLFCKFQLLFSKNLGKYKKSQYRNFFWCLCRGFGWISMIFFMKKKIEMKVVIKINVTCVILILLGKLFVHFTPAAPSSEYFNPVYPLPLILFYK